jgi:hypothetical protein
MTTMASSMSQTALFIHQMVPHHQNAVNMAKALLKTGKLECDNLTEETADCALEQILLEIINEQNFQIQVRIVGYSFICMQVSFLTFYILNADNVRCPRVHGLPQNR